MLRAAFRIAHASQDPTFVLWGGERRLLYNDAFAPLIGERHPGALGERAETALAAFWGDIGSVVEASVAGRAGRVGGVRLELRRDDRPRIARFAFSFTPIPDDEGVVQGAFCTASEELSPAFALGMRSRDDAGEVLQRYRLLVEHSRDMMLIIRGRDGRILEANSASARAYGYSREELLSRSIADLRAPETMAELAGQLDRADAGDVLFETVHVRRDGSRFPVEVSSRGETIGGVRMLVSILRDLTERAEERRKEEGERAALARLQEHTVRLVSHDELSGLVQATLQGAIAISGAPAGEVRLLDACARTWRVAARVGLDARAFGPFEGRGVFHRSDVQAPLRYEPLMIDDVASCASMGLTDRERLLAAGTRAMLVTPLSTSEGVLLGSVATHWHERHRPEDFTLRLLDVFAREAADLLERVQGRDDLRAAERKRSEFLAVVSHELRNPLAPIRNSLFVLEHAEPGSDQARRARSTVDRQIRQLVRLIDDLVDVARAANNKIRLSLQSLELGEWVHRVVDDHRSLFENAGIRLEIDVAGPVRVRADPARVSQMIGNLLLNAVKFTERGGATRVSLATDEAGRRAVVRVCDSGAGITDDALRMLFRPFVQSERTIALSKGGLGLGLSLVRTLAELHGGDVIATSAGAGRGAEFVIRLPLDAGPEESAGR
ncbi:MAG TPA: ATP-binding protein [Polyangiaceae bacterium]|nr:ATP-binding protein [Polyangiaceae bacterium]